MSSAVEELRHLLDRRIVVLDGAMGTMVQGLGLAGEDAWRGERLKNHAHSVKGCTDVLVLYGDEDDSPAPDGLDARSELGSGKRLKHREGLSHDFSPDRQ